ncbi:MAG: methyltransferase domain-containing protein [Planctomycetota bacterium]
MDGEYQGSTPSDDPEYLLGTGSDELDRLRFQHEVWRETTEALWRRAGFTTGQRLLDLGCGPGTASIDLARIVGPGGQVIAVDESERFLATLEAESRRLELRWITPLKTEVEGLDLPPGSIDGAYARWLLCFLPEPSEVVRRVARALRPGGVFVVVDYFNYLATTLAPRCAPFDRALRAVAESWRRSDGDLDIGSSLPGIFLADGLEIREIRTVARTARPGEPFWEWVERFFRGYAPRLREMGLLTVEEVEALLDAWRQRAENPASFLYVPPMLELIGVRP